MGRMVAPDALWTPDPERVQHSHLGRWVSALHGRGTLAGVSYDDAWRWSVAHPSAFWAEVAVAAGVVWDRPPDRPSDPFLPAPGAGVEGARWFSGGELNYARQALLPDTDAGPAVLARSQTRGSQELSWNDLRALVGRLRAGLQAAGVRRGDRVAGYVPNVPEALAVFLAAASLGAVWTSCAAEMGVEGVLDRFEQVEPVALVTVDGYRYGQRIVERRAEAQAIRAALPTLRVAVWVPYLRPDEPPPAGWLGWDDLTTQEGPLEFDPVPFDHPLYILYSSGTTGRPKAIVHGHGAMVVEHFKALRFHFDLGPGDRFFWFTTTGWMMWNFLVSGLLAGAAVVLFDGAPTDLWSVLAETRTACAGMGAASLVAAQKAGTAAGTLHDLRALRTLGSTGSPLPAAAAAWVYEAVKADVLLNSFSGGTDVCTGFVGANPLLPVWPGEISGRCLGAGVEVFDDAGRSVVGSEGELVLTLPLPSMPVGLWADPDGLRYHEAYFDRFPGVWAHGDRMTITERGSCVITGRSDGTLNRGGVRMGTAELYDVVEAFDEVADSLAVHVEDPEGGPGELWLFVVPAAGAAVDDNLRHRLKRALRGSLSPRHVPDHVAELAEVPRTLSDKKLEVPVKRILSGIPLDAAVTRASVANPASLDAIVALGGRG